MVTAASEMELFLPKSYDIFWSLVILIIVAVFFYKFFCVITYHIINV